MSQLSMSGQGNALRSQQRNAQHREPSRRLASDNANFSFQARGSSFGQGANNFNDRVQLGTYANEGFEFTDRRGASIESGVLPPTTNPMAPPAPPSPPSVQLTPVTSSEEKEKARLEEFHFKAISTLPGSGSRKINDPKHIAEFDAFIENMKAVVRANISVANYNSHDLLELKKRVYEVRELFGQIDLARRLRSLRWKMDEVLYDSGTGELKFDASAATIMDAVELADKLLEAQGNCEPVSQTVGGFAEAPYLSACSPLLYLYRLFVPKTVRQRILDSGWATITTLNEDSLADADMGINAMGIICALIMTVPFGLLSGAGPSFFDELEAAITTCPGRWTDPATQIIYPVTNYGWTFSGIRREFLAYVTLCIFASLDCVVISTMYYTFHRGGERDPQKLHLWWRQRGYLIVVTCGICTITAITGLFAITKTIFVYYSVSLAPVDVLLDTWWNRPANTTIITSPLTNPGVGIPFGTTQSVFQNAGSPNPVNKYISPVCSINSLEFGVPGALSLLVAITLGLYFVF